MQPVSLRMLAFIVIIMFGIAGCGSADQPAAPSSDPDFSGTSDVKRPTDENETDDGSHTDSEPADGEQKKPKKDLQISSPDDSGKGEAEGSEEDRQPDYADFDVTESYNAAQPTLMGFSIGDSMARVTERFGKPFGSTAMIDGNDALTVYEYPGFMFGVDRNQSIVFIEVNSDRVNPGLNQTRVGSTAAQAVAALGEPYSMNDFVLLYQSDGVVLKFDLDPETSAIRSIKLFAEED